MALFRRRGSPVSAAGKAAILVLAVTAAHLATAAFAYSAGVGAPPRPAPSFGKAGVAVASSSRPGRGFSSELLGGAAALLGVSATRSLIRSGRGGQNRGLKTGKVCVAASFTYPTYQTAKASVLTPSLLPGEAIPVSDKVLTPSLLPGEAIPVSDKAVLQSPMPADLQQREGWVSVASASQGALQAEDLLAAPVASDAESVQD
eukprot:CAMPEP_0197661816 /NCGR_PEP_ID=MMETSP1338-20131121/51689_1 /TAXON_ID=43686 ORGANISM="Pelagodinium beii, Strain RCC1491" /NCGR_SAMPLE_ID=MMETSP1338 /ASSEMBLY_ACC=CAM_ASM_000754 /LENGTH=202 /DNA_ID=CAMNT_0043239449 /DNA_START=32 /DNA_END=641 /DNA_ORIENTATION=+